MLILPYSLIINKSLLRDYCVIDNVIDAGETAIFKTNGARAVMGVAFWRKKIEKKKAKQKSK